MRLAEQARRAKPTPTRAEAVVARKRWAPRASGGFTLLEVLIAIVILSVGLLALEGMAVGAARTTAHAGRRSHYTAVATDALERTMSALREGQDAPGSTAPVRGDDGAVIANAAVSVVDNGELAAPSPPLRRFDVTVRVVPVSPGEASDSVRLVASVVR